MPAVTKLKFGNVGNGLSTSGSDVAQLRGEIDRQQSLVEQYRSELARRDKADEKQLKVAQWNEKKMFQAKVKEQVVHIIRDQSLIIISIITLSNYTE